MTIPLDSKIADEIQNLYKKILLRSARIFEKEYYLNKLETGEIQLSDIRTSLINSKERQQIDSLHKIGENHIITNEGIKMILDPNDNSVSGYLALNKTWEPFETFLFKKFIKKNSVFIDIGAHIGYYSLLLSSKANLGKIISFEPAPKNFELLKKNIQLNNFKNIVIINKGITNQNTTIPLYLSSEHNTGDNRIFNENLIPIENESKNILIQCIKLDDFLSEINLEPDIIKMDIQGSECLALKGMLKTLKKIKHLVLFTEFWPRAIEATCESPCEFLTILKQFNFEIFEINSNEKKLERITVKQLIKNYRLDKNPELQTNLLCLKNVELPNL